MGAIFSLAVWTYLLQGALMPVLLIFSARYLTASVFDSKREEAASPAPPDVPVPDMKLAPLNCPACGANLVLGTGQLTCSHCGAIAEEPPEYRSLFALRRATLSRLKRASTYLVRARRLSSPLVKIALILGGIWLCTVPIILMIVGSTNSTYDPIFEKLGNGVIPLFLSLGVWILVLFFTAIMTGRVRRFLPSISDWSQIGSIETTLCPACGGALSFDRGDLSTVCGFCGVETMRMQVVWQARQAVATDLESTRHSLVTARQECARAIDDLLGTPAMIVFIFVFLPAVVYSPYLLYQLFAWSPWAAVGLVGGVVVLGLVARAIRSGGGGTRP